MRRKFGYVIAAVVCLPAAAVVWGSLYLLDYSLNIDDSHARDYRHKYATLFRNYPETGPWTDSLRRAGALRDTFVTMASGERHHALFVPAREPTDRTAIVIHGYTDNAVSMLSLGYMYHHDLGFNVLLPDLHGHGRSEGREARMGWKERWDVQRWIAIADSMFRDSTGHASIVVHGVSMGGAVTMAVSGDSTPASVKCFVDDCGYTSVWDEFKTRLEVQFGLPEFPLLYTASALCKLKYGWSFGEASPLRQVEKCRKPMLFIHGDRDTFVPTSMVYTLYEAKPAPKALYIAHGSPHARSYRDHRQEYTERVRTFVERWLKRGRQGSEAPEKENTTPQGPQATERSG